MLRISFIVVCITLLTNVHYTTAQLLSSPKTQGAGAFALGGRGGKVIKVNNLNDHGPGSLREAVETEGARIIIFKVGGIIDLETKLIINHPFLTIAGQSAPGDGICIRGEGIAIRAHDVVIRYLRIRPGDINFGAPNKWDDVDAVTIAGDADEVYNIVIDHCSLSWAVDENIGIWGAPRDITIQNCIIGEALHKSKHPKGPHGMGMLIGSEATNISIHHNLFIHNNDRNPHINGANKVDFRNNIIYNPGGVAIDLTGSKDQYVNIVNNIIRRGPNTNIKTDILLRKSSTVPKLYINGNIGIKQSDPPTDNWLLVKDNNNLVPNRAMQALQAFPYPYVNTLTAKEAYTYVLQNAGAILPLRDAVDRALIYDVKSRKGNLIDSKDHVLEWPMFDEGIPLLDTDDDGMPDFWEESFGLDLNIDDANKDNDDDGYTNIEEYLNRTDPNVAGTSSSSSIATLSAGEVDYESIYESLSLSIDSVFPNPIIGDVSNMKFTVNRPSNVSLKVLNENGKEINSLVSAFLYEGQYQIQWNSSGLTAGVYLVVLMSDDRSASYKLIVSR